MAACHNPSKPYKICNVREKDDNLFQFVGKLPQTVNRRGKSSLRSGIRSVVMYDNNRHGHSKKRNSGVNFNVRPVTATCND